MKPVITYRVNNEDELPVVDLSFSDVRSANRAAMVTGTAEYDIDQYIDGQFDRTVARARHTQE